MRGYQTLAIVDYSQRLLTMTITVVGGSALVILPSTMGKLER